MSTFWLHVASAFFFVFHTALIGFNLVGWLFVRTRRLHLYTVLLTLGSWVILGIWRGFGYCFLTDWHYEVLRGLGRTDLPHSYISFLVETFSGWRPPAQTTEVATVAVIAVVLLCSVYVNFVRPAPRHRRDG